VIRMLTTGGGWCWGLCALVSGQQPTPNTEADELTGHFELCEETGGTLPNPNSVLVWVCVRCPVLFRKGQHRGPPTVQNRFFVRKGH
jgi:hypothetical protein